LLLWHGLLASKAATSVCMVQGNAAAVIKNALPKWDALWNLNLLVSILVCAKSCTTAAAMDLQEATLGLNLQQRRLCIATSKDMLDIAPSAMLHCDIGQILHACAPKLFK